MRTPIEAQRRYGGPWKPAELTDESGDDTPAVIMSGSDEPLHVPDVFAIKADSNSDSGLIEAARAAGFTVVDA